MTKKKNEIPRMTEDEIRSTVEGLVKGRIFTGTQVPPDMLHLVFMPLGLAKDVDWDSLGNVIEDIDKAGPRGINGYPMFMSCRLVHKDDWAVIGERALAVQAAMDSALGGDQATE